MKATSNLGAFPTLLDSIYMAQEDEPSTDNIPTPGEKASDPDFDYTSGEELVEQLPDKEEIPKDLRRHFWRTVLFVNGLILFVCVGLLLWAVQGMRQEGLFLIALGIFCGLFAYRLYRQFNQEYR